jgi:sensor histidine kinase YesM
MHKKTGKHLLSAEMSTFHVGQELNSIAFILSVVDEQKLNNAVLFVSMISALFFGMLLILSIIFQLVYWQYQRNFSYQLFSLFCLFSALLLSIEQAKFWVNYPYSWHIYRLSFIYSLTLCVSFILPVFYIFQYQLPSKKTWALAIIFSLLGLSMLQADYDTSSSSLFTGALIWALIINIYHLKKDRSGKLNSFVILLGLTFVAFMPEYYSEAGFGLVFICLVMLMLVTLIKEMYIHKEQSLKAQRVKTELLRRNMQPHFLMNCLTQLIELIEIKPKQATVLISALSDEFRQLTHQSDQGCIPLSD